MAVLECFVGTAPFVEDFRKELAEIQPQRQDGCSHWQKRIT
jgi:hypothetical protein